MALDQMARLLAGLDVFDQETQQLTREWATGTMMPRGGMGEREFHRPGEGGLQRSNTWQVYEGSARADFGAYGDVEKPNRWNSGGFRVWEAECAAGNGFRRWDGGEVSCSSLPKPASNQVLFEGNGWNGNGAGLVNPRTGPAGEQGYEKGLNNVVKNKGLGREDLASTEGVSGEGSDAQVRTGEELVRPNKGAFSFPKASRFAENKVPGSSPEPLEPSAATAAADSTTAKPSRNPKPQPPFARAPPRKTIIEEMVSQALPTKDLVYNPGYTLVHKRVPGASFGKPGSGRGKKRRGCGPDSKTDDQPVVAGSAWKECQEADNDCLRVEDSNLSDHCKDGNDKKSELGPGFYNVDVDLVKKRVPAVGFATLVPREEPGKTRGTEEGQQLTLDLTRALGAVNKRVKGVVGFGLGPPRFTNDDDKENQRRSELEPNYRALEPRVKGACAYRKPAALDRPKAPSPESSQLLTSRSAASSFGTASPVDTPRGVLLSPDPNPILPRHPAWKFSPPPQQGGLSKPQTRPLRELSVVETLVRPRTEGHVDFGRVTGRNRNQTQEETVGLRLKLAKQPGPGQYALAQAWRHLQRHVPSSAFGAMARRWADASVTSADGVRAVLEELSAAVRLTRPRPPAWRFGSVSASVPVRRTWDGRRALDVRISFTRPRAAAALGFDAQTGRRQDNMSASDVDLRDYAVRFDLVEPTTRATDFALGSERGLGGDVSDEGAVTSELDVAAGLDATRWRSPQMVPIARQIGRPQDQDGHFSDVDFLDQEADLPLKPHVPTVRMGANRGRWIDSQNASDGPDVGAYDLDRPIGSDAPAVDFALARGRALATRVKKRLEGDRLTLHVNFDAVKPSIPAVGINPLPSEGLNRDTNPLPEVGYYEPNLTLTHRRLLDTVDMARMQARNRVKETGLPDGERLAAGFVEYPLSDAAVKATVHVPGFGRFMGHVGHVSKSTEDGQSGLDLADGSVRPRRWMLSDMDWMVGRREEPRERFTDLDYDPDDGAFRPNVPSVRLGLQSGHQSGIAATAAGELDGGCYDATRVGERTAPAVDFVSGPTRGILDPFEPSVEGDQLILPLHSAEPGDAARRRAAAAADFARASDRWLPSELALLDRAEMGNNLLLRPEISPTRRRALEVDFSRDRPRWKWADARADAIELYGEGHFMELHVDDAPMRARVPGFDFGRVEGRSAIEAREEKHILRAMPRGAPIEHERVLEGLKLTRHNPPRTTFGQPPLPPIQESVGRGEAAERAFFNRLTKETRLNAMMERLNGGAEKGKPKRKIRVSGAVAIDLDAMRNDPGEPKPFFP